MPVNRTNLGLSQLPEYLTDEEVKDIADARRASCVRPFDGFLAAPGLTHRPVAVASWTSGFIGAGAGVSLGFLGWYSLRARQR